MPSLWVWRILNVLLGKRTSKMMSQTPAASLAKESARSLYLSPE